MTVAALIAGSLKQSTGVSAPPRLAAGSERGRAAHRAHAGKRYSRAAIFALCGPARPDGIASAAGLPGAAAAPLAAIAANGVRRGGKAAADSGSPHRRLLRQRRPGRQRPLAGQGLAVALVDHGRVVEWMPIAKDGRDLPAALRRVQRATNALTSGETRDFRCLTAHAGRLEIKVYDRKSNDMVVASLAIDVGAR